MREFNVIIIIIAFERKTYNIQYKSQTISIYVTSNIFFQKV